MVFGKRAAANCLEYVEVNDLVNLDAQEAMHQLNQSIEHYSKPVREIMWFNGNVIRNEMNLLSAVSHLGQLKSHFNMAKFINEEKEQKSAFKARNFLILSLLLKAMIERRESRGAHYREDYPAEDERYNKRLHISLNANEPIFKFL